MRPIRLEIEGFLAYKKRADVDFEGVDLFVLEGATGAGKSSVIDAMIFALYGTIPRLGNRSAVAPVINANVDTAKVRFEFSIGETVYQVVRRVERTGAGASVTEARLQRGDKTLESGSKEVTAAVSELLGLEFEHFIKAVVLPQGAFADFLTDTPRERQDLLRALLDLGLFEKVKVRANERAAAARGSVVTLEENLGKLEVPVQAELDAAEERLSTLESAIPVLKKRLEAVEALRAESTKHAVVVSALASRLEGLAAASPPDGYQSLVAGIEKARIGAKTAAEKRDAAIGRVAEIDTGIRSLPDGPTLERWVELRRTLDERLVAKKALDIEGIATAVAGREKVVGELRSEFETARSSHAVHEMRQGLTVGAACPVCGHVIDELADTGTISDEVVTARAAALEEAESGLRKEIGRRDQATGQEIQIASQIREIEAILAAAPTETEVNAHLLALGEMEESHAAATAELEAAGMAHDRANETLSKLVSVVEGLKERLIEARAHVRSEQPPTIGPDPVDGWSDFDGWRLARIDELAVEMEKASQEETAAREALKMEEGEIAEWLADLSLDPGAAPETELALAAERQRRDLSSMRETADMAVNLAAQIKEESDRANVAGSLGQHLKSNNFEAWVMLEALEVLVAGANRLLDDLSGGSYSLEVEKSGFAVVDHHNADQRRSTRSLSGGEVFLVSLSLALSMASQLADLTGSSSRLESVFLDEGFGSLDRESLDTVAAVLDELVVQGRTVGIVTHVKELAERIPVRFEVIKGPGTATIRRQG